MNTQKRLALVEALRRRPKSHNQKLAQLREEGIMISKRPDWLWHLLLSSMSTMGNSRGYDGLILNSDNYLLVSYNTLLNLHENNRFMNLTIALGNAKVRRYTSKAIWLNNNFSFIQDCGGLIVVQSLLLQTRGRQSKIRLMKNFDGIGNKYARNIFMDLNHPDFENSVAIDERITDISENLEVDSINLAYTDHEIIFIEIAKDSGITPWELDRLLYNFKTHYISMLDNNL
jgi:hypothetical protein